MLPYLIAAIAGAAINNKASQDALKRQNAEIANSLERQKGFQVQAEQKAMDTAKEFAAPERFNQQEQLAQEIEQSLIKPVSESQAIRAQQQTTQGDVSGDYETAKAASDLQTVKQAEQMARLLGKTSGAGRLRMNESIKMMDTGQAIDQLANFSRGTQGADNIAIQQAGATQSKDGFLGSLLQAVGSAGMISSAMGGASSASKLAVNSQPTLAASASAAPVFDIHNAGTVGGQNNLWARWLK